MSNIETIYIPLLEEGTPTVRPTLAEKLPNGTYKVMLPEKGYNPDDEIWEFLPGSIVRCRSAESVFGNAIILAYENVGQ